MCLSFIDLLSICPLSVYHIFANSLLSSINLSNLFTIYLLTFYHSSVIYNLATICLLSITYYLLSIYYHLPIYLSINYLSAYTLSFTYHTSIYHLSAYYHDLLSVYHLLSIIYLSSIHSNYLSSILFPCLLYLLPSGRLGMGSVTLYTLLSLPAHWSSMQFYWAEFNLRSQPTSLSPPATIHSAALTKKK